MVERPTGLGVPLAPEEPEGLGIPLVADGSVSAPDKGASAPDPRNAEIGRLYQNLQGTPFEEPFRDLLKPPQAPPSQGPKDPSVGAPGFGIPLPRMTEEEWTTRSGGIGTLNPRDRLTQVHSDYAVDAQNRATHEAQAEMATRQQAAWDSFLEQYGGLEGLTTILSSGGDVSAILPQLAELEAMFGADQQSEFGYQSSPLDAVTLTGIYEPIGAGGLFQLSALQFASPEQQPSIILNAVRQVDDRLRANSQYAARNLEQSSLANERLMILLTGEGGPEKGRIRTGIENFIREAIHMAGMAVEGAGYTAEYFLYPLVALRNHLIGDVPEGHEELAYTDFTELGDTLEGMGQAIQDWGQKTFPGDEYLAFNTLLNLAGMAGGSMMFLLTSVIARGMGASVPGAAFVGALSPALAEVSDFMELADKEQIDGVRRLGGFIAGLGIGATEMIPLSHLFAALDRVGGPGLISRIFRNAPSQAGEEGIQEFAQTMLEFMTEEQILGVQSELDAAEQLGAAKRASGYGAFLGAFLGVGFSLPGGGRRDDAGDADEPVPINTKAPEGVPEGAEPAATLFGDEEVDGKTAAPAEATPEEIAAEILGGDPDLSAIEEALRNWPIEGPSTPEEIAEEILGSDDPVEALAEVIRQSEGIADEIISDQKTQQSEAIADEILGAETQRRSEAVADDILAVDDDAAAEAQVNASLDSVLAALDREDSIDAEDARLARLAEDLRRFRERDAIRTATPVQDPSVPVPAPTGITALRGAESGAESVFIVEMAGATRFARPQSVAIFDVVSEQQARDIFADQFGADALSKIQTMTISEYNDWAANIKQFADDLEPDDEFANLNKSELEAEAKRLTDRLSLFTQGHRRVAGIGESAAQDRQRLHRVRRELSVREGLRFGLRETDSPWVKQVRRRIGPHLRKSGYLGPSDIPTMAQTIVGEGIQPADLTDVELTKLLQFGLVSGLKDPEVKNARARIIDEISEAHSKRVSTAHQQRAIKRSKPRVSAPVVGLGEKYTETPKRNARRSSKAEPVRRPQSRDRNGKNGSELAASQPPVGTRFGGIHRVAVGLATNPGSWVHKDLKVSEITGDQMIDILDLAGQVSYGVLGDTVFGEGGWFNPQTQSYEGEPSSTTSIKGTRSAATAFAVAAAYLTGQYSVLTVTPAASFEDATHIDVKVLVPKNADITAKELYLVAREVERKQAYLDDKMTPSEPLFGGFSPIEENGFKGIAMTIEKPTDMAGYERLMRRLNKTYGKAETFDTEITQDSVIAEFIEGGKGGEQYIARLRRETGASAAANLTGDLQSQAKAILTRVGPPKAYVEGFRHGYENAPDKRQNDRGHLDYNRGLDAGSNEANEEALAAAMPTNEFVIPDPATERARGLWWVTPTYARLRVGDSVFAARMASSFGGAAEGLPGWVIMTQNAAEREKGVASTVDYLDSKADAIAWLQGEAKDHGIEPFIQRRFIATSNTYKQLVSEWKAKGAVAEKVGRIMETKVGLLEPGPSVMSDLGASFPIYGPVSNPTPSFASWYKNSVVQKRVYHAGVEDFTEFRTNKSMGAHFGTSLAANDMIKGMLDDIKANMAVWHSKSLDPLPNVGAYWLSLQNPVRLPDLVGWDPFVVVNQLAYQSKKKPRIPESLAPISVVPGLENSLDLDWNLAPGTTIQGLLNAIDKAREEGDGDTDELGYAPLHQFLIDNGYDGVVYQNKFEGEGAQGRPGERVDSYIVFKSSQVKSATGNNGEFAPVDNVLGASAPTFYSAALRWVESHKQEKHTPKEWINLLRKAPGVKPSELEFLDVIDWLNGFDATKDTFFPRKIITRDELARFIASNELTVEEHIKERKVTSFSEIEWTALSPRVWTGSSPPGAPWDWSPSIIEQPQDGSAQAGFYSAYTSNSRAIGLYPTLEAAKNAVFSRLQMDTTERTRPRYGKYTMRGSAGHDYRELLIKLPTERFGYLYKHAHWEGQHNVVAHIRFDISDYGDLIIEEIQSDWFQAGQSQGFKDEAKIKKAEAALDEALLSARIADQEITRLGMERIGGSWSGNQKYLSTNAGVGREVRLVPWEPVEELGPRDAAGTEGLIGRYLEAAGASITPDVQRGPPENDQMGWRLRHVATSQLFSPWISPTAHDAFVRKFGGEFSNYETMTLEQVEATEKYAVARENLDAAERALRRQKNASVPKAPLHNSWLELAMKRMIRWAAENGYNKIQWTDGAVQSQRYEGSGEAGLINFYDYKIPQIAKKMGRKFKTAPVHKPDVEHLQWSTQVVQQASALWEVEGKSVGPFFYSYDGDVDEMNERMEEWKEANPQEDIPDDAWKRVDVDPVRYGAVDDWTGEQIQDESGYPIEASEAFLVEDKMSRHEERLAKQRGVWEMPIPDAMVKAALEGFPLFKEKPSLLKSSTITRRSEAKRRKRLESSGGYFAGRAGLAFDPFKISPDQVQKIVNNIRSIIGRIATPAVEVVFEEEILRGDANVISGSAADKSKAFGGIYSQRAAEAGRAGPGQLPVEQLIRIALHHMGFDPLTSAYHEAYHSVEMALMSDQEFALVRADIARPNSWIVRMAAAEWSEMSGGARTFTEAEMRTQPPYELAAIAFQRYARLKDHESLNLSGLHIAIRKTWDRILEVLKQVRRMLNRQGYTSVESLFKDIATGKLAKGRTPTAKLASRVAMDNAYMQGRAMMEAGMASATPGGFNNSSGPFQEGGDQQRQGMMMGGLAAGMPIDRMFRVPWHVFGGLDAQGRWNPGANLWKKDPYTTGFAIVGAGMGMSFGPVGVVAGAAVGGAIGRLFNPKTRVPWSAGDNFLEKARAGLIDRYGLDEEYKAREYAAGVEGRARAREAMDILQKLVGAGVTATEARVLQQILTDEVVPDKEFAKLSEPIRDAIDTMGQELVELGLLSAESYERNRGAYLHRVYLKHESELGGLTGWLNKRRAKARHRIMGSELQGRGLWSEVDAGKVPRTDSKGWTVGDRFRMIDKMSEPDDSADARPRVLARRYIREDENIPDGFIDRGLWEVRSAKKGNLVMWRDYTKEERLKMGEILDARYTITKTFMLAGNDIATGKFYQDIADNPEWSTSDQPLNDDEWIVANDFNRKVMGAKIYNRTIKWVKVPETAIPKTGGKPRWGALAGKWVRTEIWRDLNEVHIAHSENFYRSLLTQWKKHKTARSPVVHMNNVMSNFILMDLADVGITDLVRALRQFGKKGGPDYEAANAAGAFGTDVVTQELRNEILDPLLKEIEEDMTGGVGSMENRAHLLGRIADAIWDAAKAGDRKMLDLYKMEDEMFRLAVFIKRRRQGMPEAEAAIEARDQFLNYDIRAPWVNTARRTMLPFASFTYRAVPLIAKGIATRPWKMMKYVAIAHAINAIGYAMFPGDEDEERRSLRSEEEGYTWIGAPRLLRMPWGDAFGNPVFLDVRRWIPAGDIYDFNQGQIPFLPSPLHWGGPIMLGAELFLNRTAFTGEDIYNPLTQTVPEMAAATAGWLWRSWMPSAAWVPGSWYWNRIGRAIKGATEWDGRPYTMLSALLSSVGIKAKGQDIESGFALWSFRFREIESELRSEANRLASQVSRGLISENAFDRAMDRIIRKVEIMEREAQERFGDF